MLPRLLILVIVAIAMAFIAKKKGFNPLLWVLAAGPIGLVILLFLPNAVDNSISEKANQQRAQFANMIGGFLTGVVGIFALLFFYLIANPGEV